MTGDDSRSGTDSGRRYGVFAELEPVDVGYRTNAAADHDYLPDDRLED